MGGRDFDIPISSVGNPTQQDSTPTNAYLIFCSPSGIGKIATVLSESSVHLKVLFPNVQEIAQLSFSLA